MKVELALSCTIEENELEYKNHCIVFNDTYYVAITKEQYKKIKDFMYSVHKPRDSKGRFIKRS